MKIVSLTDEAEYFGDVERHGLWKPECPYCPNESGIEAEADAYFVATCNSCGKQFRVEGI